jgi:hypothetical protein
MAKRKAKDRIDGVERGAKRTKTISDDDSKKKQSMRDSPAQYRPNAHRKIRSLKSALETIPESQRKTPPEIRLS